MIDRMRTQRLYRSRTDVMLAGVAAGIGEYLAVDPTLVRVLFVIGSLVIPALPIVYLAMALIVPAAPADRTIL